MKKLMMIAALMLMSRYAKGTGERHLKCKGNHAALSAL